MIYLCSFKEFEGTNGISLCEKQPFGCDYPVYHQLTPYSSVFWNYKKGVISQDKFTEIYNNQLKDLNVIEVGESLQEKTLLDWVGPTKFSHRELVKNWLISGGFEVSWYKRPLVIDFGVSRPIPHTCLYCRYGRLAYSPVRLICYNPESSKYHKSTQKPQRRACTLWEEKEYR